ncbi:MAG TPA: proprotein convertase P-domain-containing protein [Thermoanaerobaculia bacterium]|nr:proprotein convertase P-domain-containing protein [Thermoanaerobaculia bacterium]
MIPLLLAAIVELRLDYTRVSLTKTVRHYTQLVDGIEVAGGERIEENGRVVFDRLGQQTRMSALHGAQTFLSARPALHPGATPAYVNVDGTLRPALRVVEFARPMEPYERWYDSETGALLRERPLFYTVKGRVFDVNPVAKLNDPSLRDQNNSAAAVPDAAYSVVDLPDLAPAAPLAGPNAQIVDVEAPFTVHADPAKPLDTLNRSQPEFEEVNAYFQIDRAQRYLQSLGYAGARRLVDYSIPIDAHAANGTDNSYFIQSNPPGHGTLYFGDGGTDDAEDSDIMLHEFMHAIHNWIAPGALSGGSSSQAAALAEGLGDYWSFSSTYDATRATGRDPACIADWDARCEGDADSENCGYPADADCLRRVDSTKTLADFKNSTDPGTEHLNGEIWSSALRDIFLAIGKENTDRIVLESLFGIPPSPSFHDLAQRMVESDRALRGGADVNVICGAMTLRGIFAAGECGAPLKGEYTSHPAPITVTPIPDDGTPLSSSVTINDPRAIVSVAVRVDVRHQRRGDLAITLIAPDGSEFVLKQTSDADQTADLHATYGLDAAPVASLTPLVGQPAQGTWTLVVVDKFPGDVGALESWSLLLKLTGDTTLAARPQLAVRKVVPAAGHLTGALGRQYVSDLWLYSAGGGTVTLLFTPSGADGTTDFAAMPVAVCAHCVVRLDDVVVQLGTTGLGQLELTSDAPFIATSRTYYRDANGTHGDRIAALDVSNAGTSAVVARNYGAYWNLGFANVTGSSGVVRVNGIDHPVAPYSHVQFGDASNIGDFQVVSGGISIIAYGSVIENDDFAVYRALPRSPQPRGILDFRSVGSWNDHLWAVDATNHIIDPPQVIVGVFFLPGAPAGGAIFERIEHMGETESVSHFEPSGLDVIGLDASEPFRTNAGVQSLSDIAFNPLTVSLWDAQGNSLGSLVFPRGSGIAAVLDPRVARVSGGGTFASVIDNRSGDATFIPAQ